MAPRRVVGEVWKVVVAGLAVASLLTVAGCTKNPTSVNREIAARPRVEQLALSSAMESAYRAVDFGLVKDRKVYVETKALAKTDVEFITSFVQQRVVAAGGTVILNPDAADLKMTSTVEVSGTDEVNRLMRKDVIMGQFKGSLAVIDVASDTIVQMYPLDSLSQTKRNRKANTKVVGGK